MMSIITIRNFFTLVASIALVSLSSCLDDKYDPDYRKPSPIPDVQIPDGFNWETTSSFNLSINVDDKYDGRLYYEVSVYDSNPFSNENAQLLTKGLAKKGKEYSTILVIPQDLEQLYICQTMKMKDGSKQEAVKVINTDEVNLKCDFTNTNYQGESENKSNAPQKNNQIEPQPEVPKNAIPIKGNGFKLEENKDYVVEAGSIFEKGINGWGDFHNSRIYVLGTFAPNNGNLNISHSSGFIVLKGGVLKFKNKLDLNNSSYIINYGTIESADISTSNSGTYIHNYGTLVTAGDFNISSSSYVINDGIIKGNNIETNNPDVYLKNNGTLTLSGNFNVKSNSDFYNNCYTRVEGTFTTYTDLCTHLGREALLSCENLKTDSGSGIELDYHAMFEITGEADLSSSSRCTIISTDDSENYTALIKINKISEKIGWEAMTFEGRLQVYISQKDKYDSNYIKFDEGTQLISSLDNSITISSSGCNGEGNNVEEKEPEGSDFPIIVSSDNSYTFLMEDNWPTYGDYDMNDLVMDVKLVYEEKENGYIEELEISATLRAVGATKSLAAAVQLDNIKKEAIQGIEYDDDSDFKEYFLDGSVFECDNNKMEKDQEYVVIPFFDDAHKTLGITNGRPIINTISQNENIKSKTIEIEIEFKDQKVKREDINIKHLNFFITTDGKKNQRKEVHLKGYHPTNKADERLFNNNDDASYDDDYYVSKEGLVWGLMLPSNKKTPFKYSLEYTNIKTAYPKFEDWTKSKGTSNKDWYKIKNANKDYIYQ